MSTPAISPLTKNQWKSVVLNSLFAFVSAFLPIVAASDSLDKTVIGSAIVAGIMAVFKVIEKSLKTE